MSLDAVARASGISTERLLAIFRGDFDPDLDLIGEIATVLGVSLSELLAEPGYPRGRVETWSDSARRTTTVRAR
jgi:transcriptional regulator with XRE-family HTH domain